MVGLFWPDFIIGRVLTKPAVHDHSQRAMPLRSAISRMAESAEGSSSVSIESSLWPALMRRLIRSINLVFINSLNELPEC
jgi:3-deoxy-D-manno-octulosonic-acid transferase